MTQTITHDDKALAILLRTRYQEVGVKFFTPDDFSQQLAFMNQP